jgi:hypothetical protein
MIPKFIILWYPSHMFRGSAPPGDAADDEQQLRASVLGRLRCEDGWPGAPADWTSYGSLDMVYTTGRYHDTSIAAWGILVSWYFEVPSHDWLGYTRYLIIPVIYSDLRLVYHDDKIFSQQSLPVELIYQVVWVYQYSHGDVRLEYHDSDVEWVFLSWCMGNYHDFLKS